MVAASVTGRGTGGVVDKSNHSLTAISDGPSIILAGIVTVLDDHSSPPSPTNIVEFPFSLIGGSENYVVILTGIGTGSSYVAVKSEDGNGNFSGFTIVADNEGDVQYIVATTGIKPK